MTTSNIKLTNHQQKTLAIIHNSSSPEIAHSKTSTGEKILAALDILEQNNIINRTESAVEITDVGKEVMRYNGMLDDNNELTTNANALINERQTFLEFINNY